MSTFRHVMNSMYDVVAGDKAAGAMSGFRYTRQLILVACAATLCGAGLYGYRWYAERREQQAYKIFTECLQEYAKVQKNPALLPNVELVLKAGYEKHQSSRLAPYFLVYRADVLTKQNKKDEALELMHQALKLMPTNAPVYSLYMTKRALMRIDQGGQELEAGLQELETLARNEKNINRDMALYYLGLYHWSKNDLPQAKNIWQELVALPKQEAQSRSAWAGIVQEKLQQIV